VRVEEVQQHVLGSVLGTADSEKPDYWVRRRSAAAAGEAFRISLLCMLVQNGRGRCMVFMGAA